MVHQPISHSRFVDVARFWVIDLERLVAAMAICFLDELLV
jgi:hypothetical protein